MRKLLLILSVLSLVVLAGCAMKISEIRSNQERYVGKEVVVSGTVENAIKLGGLSGFTIKDDTGSIGVSSKSLPEEGSKAKVKGTLMKDTLFGYYILAKDIS